MNMGRRRGGVIYQEGKRKKESAAAKQIWNSHGPDGFWPWWNINVTPCLCNSCLNYLDKLLSSLQTSHKPPRSSSTREPNSFSALRYPYLRNLVIIFLPSSFNRRLSRRYNHRFQYDSSFFQRGVGSNGVKLRESMDIILLDWLIKLIKLIGRKINFPNVWVYRSI